MKFFIIVFCIFSTASAGFTHSAHKTTIGHHGVPLESAENIAARDFHQAAHSKATSYHINAAAQAGPWVEESYNKHDYGSSAWAAPITNQVFHAEPMHKWSGPQHLPVIGHNGVPVDTNENNARRALHHAAYAKAISRGNSYAAGQVGGHSGSHSIHAEPVRQWTGPQHIPVISHSGVPVDTNENNARRALHYAAYAKAISRGSSHAAGQVGGHSGSYSIHAEPVRQWTGPQHLPVISHSGVPVDTNENNARRALHHSVYAEAVARNGKYSVGHGGAEGQSTYISAAWNNQNSYSNKNQW